MLWTCAQSCPVLCSPALRRAGQGDLNSAVKEAMKSLSQQSKQIAEILDATSREQTGASMEHHMRRSRDAAEGVASVFSERAQGLSSYSHFWQDLSGLTSTHLKPGITLSWTHFSLQTAADSFNQLGGTWAIGQSGNANLSRPLTSKTSSFR